MNDHPLSSPSRIKEAISLIPQCRELGMEVVAIDGGAITVRVDHDPRLVGNPETGHLHGGVVTTLLDTASGLAVLSTIPSGTTLATLDLRIDYLRPGAAGKPILARAECYRHTRNVVFVRGEAYQDDVAEPIASSVATFMLGSTGFDVDQGQPEA